MTEPVVNDDAPAAGDSMSTSGDASRPPPPTAIVCKPCAPAATEADDGFTAFEAAPTDTPARAKHPSRFSVCYVVSRAAEGGSPPEGVSVGRVDEALLREGDEILHLTKRRKHRSIRLGARRRTPWPDGKAVIKMTLGHETKTKFPMGEIVFIGLTERRLFA